MTRPARRGRRLLLALVALLALAFLLDRLFPPPLPAAGGDGATLVLAADGTPLRALAGADGVWRYPVTPEQVSPLYLEALLGYEDRWFHAHPGVNPLALLRAAGQALVNGRVVSGGSTLTMQVARLIEPGRRDALGKLRQMLRALQLEWRLDKREILALYLERAPFGGTIEGVAAASWAYLGKPPDRLSRAEAALLAVLPQAPSRLRPDRHPDAARAARDKVLRRLGDLGIWSPAALAEAQLEPVTARRLVPPLAAALLAERLAAGAPERRVHETLIDADLQATVERRVAAYLTPLPARTSAAVLVVENRHRAVRAYVGSASYGDPDRLGHVDMVAALRSPGSTLKPFVYGLALDDGLIHSESLLVDAPQSFDGYKPANFGDHFNGPVSAAEALRLSLNVPAVDLLARVGPARFAGRLAHAGLPLALPRGAAPNLSLVLGGAGARLEHLVAAYVALARGGLAGPLRFQPDDPDHARRLLSDGAAFIVRSMLEAHPRPGDAVQGLDLSQRRRLAWKTGTSYGFRDSWAIGVTPGYTVGVWIGRPDGTPLPGHYGAATAAPLLFALVDALPRHAEDRGVPVPPPDVRSADICWPLGGARDATPAEACHETRTAWVLASVVPPTLPSWETRAGPAPLETVLRDPVTGLRVRPDCASGATPRRELVARWPVLAEPWIEPARRAANALPVWSPDCAAADGAPVAALRIAGLADGGAIRAAPGARTAPVVELRALGAEGTVDWLLDGRLVGRSAPGAALTLALDRPGRRSLVALDSRGRYDRVGFTVLR